jgi:hypothetical protein
MEFHDTLVKLLHSSWLDYIRSIIQSNEFQNVWLNQTNINKKWFSQTFKPKIKGQYLQTWNDSVRISSSSITYRLIKIQPKLNQYFQVLSNHYSRILTKFRTRNHRLPIEVGRWHNTPLYNRICPYCHNNSCIGDEMHFILECNHFEQDRKRLIKPYYYIRSNTLKFSQLFNSTNKRELINLAKFVEIIVKHFKTYM